MLNIFPLTVVFLLTSLAFFSKQLVKRRKEVKPNAI
jgi:hypothetical protein